MQGREALNKQRRGVVVEERGESGGIGQARRWCACCWVWREGRMAERTALAEVEERRERCRDDGGRAGEGVGETGRRDDRIWADGGGAWMPAWWRASLEPRGLFRPPRPPPSAGSSVATEPQRAVVPVPASHRPPRAVVIRPHSWPWRKLVTNCIHGTRGIHRYQVLVFHAYAPCTPRYRDSSLRVQ